MTRDYNAFSALSTSKNPRKVEGFAHKEVTPNGSILFTFRDFSRLFINTFRNEVMTYMPHYIGTYKEHNGRYARFVKELD